jgi:glucoamylase
MPSGKNLRIALMASAMVHWSSDGWKTTSDVTTRDTRTGIHVADLPTSQLERGRSITFTMFWPQDQRWEGTDFPVTIE